MLVMYFFLHLFIATERTLGDLEFDVSIGRNFIVSNNIDRAYIIHPESYEVYIVDYSGRVLDIFAGKGEGPGETSMPTKIFIKNDNVYIFERGSNSSKLLQFSKKGVFIKKYYILEEMFFPKLQPLNNDWYIEDVNRNEAHIKSAMFYISDKDFKKMDLIFKGVAIQTGWLETNGCEIKFNPVEKPTETFVTSDSKFIVLHHPDKSVITLYDIRKSKVVRNFKIPFRKKVFDIKWGEEQLRERCDIEKVCKIVPDFPNTFPYVRDVKYSLFDGILVTGWKNEKTKKRPFSFFNVNGNNIKLPVSLLLESRILAKCGNVYIVLLYDKEKDIYRVKMSDLDSLKREDAFLDFEENIPTNEIY